MPCILLILNDGYEGQMVRNTMPLMKTKGLRIFLKEKNSSLKNLTYIEVMEGDGNWAGYAKHFRLELGDGREFKSGVRGNFRYTRKNY